MDALDLHWLIGILEGEATIGAGPPSSPGSPLIRVEMTDSDVVQRVGGLWARAVFPVRPRRDGYRVPYITVLKGTPAVTLMTTIRPYMGWSRQEQIDRAVATWHGRRERRGSRHASTTSAIARALNDAHWLGSPAF